MQFVYLKGWDGGESEWWRWIPERMRLVNFMGGGFDIDENSEYWANAKIYTFENWHELYKSKGFNPLKADVYDFDVWISPEGVYFDGNAHAVAAEYIVKLVYGIDIDDPCFVGSAEYYLEQHHWIKATRSFMWEIYLKHSNNWEMTPKTYGALVEYCNKSDKRKLGIPKGVRIIYEKDS